MEIAKKITVGGINGIRAGFKDIKGREFVARIAGLVSSVNPKTTTFGVSYEFIGEFLATNMDGEMIAGPKCYLPSPADGLLVAAVDAAGGKSVEFGFDIFVQEVPKTKPSDIGYEYKIKPLIELKVSSPLEKLLSGMAPLVIAPKQATLALTDNVLATEPVNSPEVSNEATQAPAQTKKK